ncbi:hypothetical protein [Enterococcus rivorum]|uniref:hypothetical protein n=1 Tax=Enterococcus rivorum TaxID=762845 RepID=UPI001B8000B5|nr:hypothetical protein [Enterococcus rivorum]
MLHGLIGRGLRGYLLGLDYEESTHLDVPQIGFFKIQKQKISFITDDYEAF